MLPSSQQKKNLLNIVPPSQPIPPDPPLPHATLERYSLRLPKQSAFLVCQRYDFIQFRARFRVVSQQNLSQRRAGQREHQRGGMSNLSRIPERALRVSERGLGVAKDPHGQRPSK